MNDTTQKLDRLLKKEAQKSDVGILFLFGYDFTQEKDLKILREVKASLLLDGFAITEILGHFEGEIENRYAFLVTSPKQKENFKESFKEYETRYSEVSLLDEINSKDLLMKIREIKGKDFVFEKMSKTCTLSSYYPTQIRSIKYGKSYRLLLEEEMQKKA